MNLEVERQHCPHPMTWPKWGLLGCLLNALAWLGAVIYAAGGPQRLLSEPSGIGTLLLLWPLLGSILTTGVALLAGQAKGVAPAGATGLVALQLLLTAISLAHVFTSESSTAGLGLVTLPLIGVALALVGGLVVLGAAALPTVGR